MKMPLYIKLKVNGHWIICSPLDEEGSNKWKIEVMDVRSLIPEAPEKIKAMEQLLRIISDIRRQVWEELNGLKAAAAPTGD